MICSMTGFGRGEVRTARFAVSVEIRSVNNRNLRVNLRLPDRIAGLEADLEKQVRDTVSRGTVAISVDVEDFGGDAGYIVDPAVIRNYRAALKELGPEEVPLSTLVLLPGAVRRKSIEEIPAELKEAVFAALKSALDEFVATRRKEGAFLWADMQSRCATIQELVDRIEARVPKMVEEYRKRLADRLGKLLKGLDSRLTDDDLRKELAIFADRSDVSEEITRLRSHLNLLLGASDAQEPYGRKLEFITQEMFREANTIASKASDSQMIHDALDIKAEIEKLREQALNVE